MGVFEHVIALNELLCSERQRTRLAYRALCGLIATWPDAEDRANIASNCRHMLDSWENDTRCLTPLSFEGFGGHPSEGMGGDVLDYLDAASQEGTLGLMRSMSLSDEGVFALATNNDGYRSALHELQLERLRLELHDDRAVNCVAQLALFQSVHDVDLTVGGSVSRNSFKNLLEQIPQAAHTFSIEDVTPDSQLMTLVPSFVSQRSGSLRSVDIRGYASQLILEDLHPVVDRISLFLTADKIGLLEQLASQVHELHVWVDGDEPLFTGPPLYFESLTSLTIVQRKGAHTNDVLSAILARMRTPKLERLRAHNLDLVTDKLNVADSLFPNLRWIELRNCDVSTPLVQALLTDSDASSLVGISLRNCTGATHLLSRLATPEPMVLRDLHLEATPVSDHLLTEVLTKCGGVLENLSVDIPIEPSRLGPLFGLFANVTSLNLGNTKLEGESFSLLTEAALEQLRELAFGVGWVKDHQWDAFWSANWVQKLWRLRIWNHAARQVTYRFPKIEWEFGAVVDACFVGFESVRDYFKRHRSPPPLLWCLEAPWEAIATVEDARFWQELPDLRPTFRASVKCKKRRVDK